LHQINKMGKIDEKGIPFWEFRKEGEMIEL
jgi:hypothetical protein